MAIDMFGNFTPDPNPFISQPTEAMLQPGFSYTPPSMAEQIGQGIQRSFDSTTPQQIQSLFGDAYTAPVDFANLARQGAQQQVGQQQASSLQGLLRGAGQYYLGRENIQDVQQLGREQQQRLEELAGRSREETKFRPYTVTSGLGRVVTDPTGGIAVQLSPEQQALQAQLQSQAAGLFGQVGQDPAAQQAAIFEQIRATQRPEEERQRLALEERMLSQGRLGLGSAAYGGSSPELLAQETARQEALARASLSAREQVMAEQQQAQQAATGLLEAAYRPQREALLAFGAADPVASLADVGRREGAQIGLGLERSGFEARLQAEELANQLRLQQQQGLLTSALGAPATAQQQSIVAAMPTGSLKDMAEAALRQQAQGAIGGLFSRIFGGG